MAKSAVIPTFLYRDAPAMIDWLCDVLGFARHAVYADDAGGIAHAELTLGDGMVMLGSVRDTAFGALQGPPGDGRAGASPYLVLPDDAAVEAAHARAVAAGAEIAMPLEAKDYGGLAVTIRDPEGGLWNLGSYDPWDAAKG